LPQRKGLHGLCHQAQARAVRIGQVELETEGGEEVRLGDGAGAAADGVDVVRGLGDGDVGEAFGPEVVPLAGGVVLLDLGDGGEKSPMVVPGS